VSLLFILYEVIVGNPYTLTLMGFDVLVVPLKLVVFNEYVKSPTVPIETALLVDDLSTAPNGTSSKPSLS
ncbi:hypothetical protein RRF55_29420, partial [Klebsiella sp. K47]|uniref:hypothetical protein n=1 Tax=Klebsiella sp. K47 TaxID=3077736 RepID=UPI003F48C4B5